MKRLINLSAALLLGLCCSFMPHSMLGQNDNRMKRDLALIEQIVKDLFNAHPSFNVQMGHHKRG